MTTTERQPILQRLREHATLGKVPTKELEWIAANGHLQHYAAGDMPIKRGEAPGLNALMIVFSGHMALYMNRGRGRQRVAEWSTGEISGVLPYSRLTVAVGDGVAETDTELWLVDRDRFPEMIRECPEVTAICVHTMLDRARLFNSADWRDEKLVALGKLAAGLAHELNNPAAALVRSAKALNDILGQAGAAARALGALALPAEQIARLEALRDGCLAAPVRTWAPLERADREDELTTWIERHGGDPGMAGSLAETGVSVEAMEQVAKVVSGDALHVAIHWIASACSIRRLTTEVERGASRVSELVTAVKGFTAMDRSTVAQPVDVGRGVSDTIIVLRSKAAAKSVSLIADIDPHLPPVQGVSAELNQIWANLVDNALDAVGEGGHVTARARWVENRVIVEVTDDGPGVPPDIRERIFDPFFSTKDVGKGVGLGLDIVRRTLDRHDGEIEVESRPGGGHTVFRVKLPAEGMRSSGRFSRSTSRVQVEE